MIGHLLLVIVAADPGGALELWPNFQTIGVNVRLSADDPEMDCVGELEYGASQDRLFEGWPLARVDDQHRRLSGCIFWRQPDTTYHVRVTLRDKTTAALDGVVLTGQVTTRREPVFLKTGRQLFVSPQGSGQRFTRQSPGKLSDGLAQVAAGERLVLLRGRYHVGNLTLAHDGTETAPIQIEGDFGHDVVLDGAESSQPNWEPVTGQEGMYATTTEAANPNLVLADGVRLYPHRMYEDLSVGKISAGLSNLGAVLRFDAELDGFYRNPSGSPLLNPGWRTPRRLYVKFRDLSDPHKKRFAITRFARGLTLDGRSHVLLRDLQFVHYGVSPGGTALHLRNCRDVVIDHCRLGPNDIGLMLEGNCSRITVQHCELLDAMDKWFAWKIKASYDNAAPHSQIFPYYSRMLERGGILYQHGYSGRGIVVRHSKFHDFAQAGHLGPPSVNAAHPDSYEIDFHDNQVSNCCEDGLELDGDARNVRIWGNVFSRCNAPISLAVAQGGPVFLLRNTFHSLVEDLFTIDPREGLKRHPGHPLKFETGDSKSRIAEILFAHNTIDAGGQARGLDLVSVARWQRFVARNNIIQSHQGESLVVGNAQAIPLLELDYNLYFRTGEGPVGRFGTKPGLAETLLKSVGDARKLGHEAHGIFGDPKFVDVDEHDYALAPGNPAIDRGERLPGINDDYHGRGPDLGAIERKPPAQNAAP